MTPTDKFLSLNQVLEIVSLGKTDWYKRVGEGTAPNSYAFSKRCVRWSLIEISEWIEKEKARLRNRPRNQEGVSHVND